MQPFLTESSDHPVPPSIVVITGDLALVSTVKGASASAKATVAMCDHYDPSTGIEGESTVVAYIVDYTGESQLAKPLVGQPSPAPPVVAVVDKGGPKALECLRRGAWDVVESPVDIPSLVRILTPAIAEGHCRIKDRALIEDYYQRTQALTDAEREVLEAVCAGKLNKQIARELDVSIRTIEQRRRRVFSKMNVASAVPLAHRVAEVRTLQRLARPSLPPLLGPAFVGATTMTSSSVS